MDTEPRGRRIMPVVPGHVGICDAAPVFFPTMVISGYEDLARSLRIAWFLDRSAAVSFEEARAQYLNNRVLDQIKFYKNRGRRKRLAFKKLGP